MGRIYRIKKETEYSKDALIYGYFEWFPKHWKNTSMAFLFGARINNEIYTLAKEGNVDLYHHKKTIYKLNPHLCEEEIFSDWKIYANDVVVKDIPFDPLKLSIAKSWNKMFKDKKFKTPTFDEKVSDTFVVKKRIVVINTQD